ncbi:MAG: hypothetical protein R3A47_06155 [Polyangiales bacterium]
MSHKRSLPFALLLLVAGCGDDSSTTIEPNVAYPNLDCDSLVPEFCGYPFPSNVYTVVDDSSATGLRVQFGTNMVRGNTGEPWLKSDGFSAGAQMMTFLSGATSTGLASVTDPSLSLTDDSKSIILNAETGERVKHFVELDRRANAERRGIHIVPADRLQDGTRYIVALRNVVDSNGNAIAASAGFAALRDGTSIEDTTIEERRPLYADIFNRLSDAGFERSDLQIAWDFTTASDANNTTWMLHMRDTALDLVDTEGAQFTITSVNGDWYNEDPNRADTVAFHLEGTFRVPLFVDKTDPGAVLNFGDDGLPAINEGTPWADIPFEMIIPKSALTTPAGVIQYGHGLFGSASQIRSSHFLSFMNEYNYIMFATDLQGMSSADVPDVSVKLLTADLDGLRSMFDRLHQGFLNHLVLMRTIKTAFADDATYGQYVDPSKAYYYGISQGGIQGGVYMALSTDVERGCLGVMGQPYNLLVFRSSDFDQFLTAINASLRDPREHQLVVGLVQMLWDRVEPNGYSHHIAKDPLPGTQAKTVLMRAALGDHQVNNVGAHVMARAVGTKHLESGLQEVSDMESVTGSNTGSTYIEYGFGLPPDPACNEPQRLCGDPHENVRRLDEARVQLDEFFRTGTVTNRCVDGVCDFPSMSECTPEDTAEVNLAVCAD